MSCRLLRLPSSAGFDLLFCPKQFPLFPGIDIEDLTVHMAAEVFTGKKQYTPCHSFHWHRFC